MAFAYWLVSAFLTLRSVVLGYLLGTGTYDATFFTYINYGILTLSMALLLLSMWHIPAYELWVLFVLPLVWGTTVFVALAIVVIVQLNDGVFLKTTTQNHGTNSVATIHTGDWMLHQLPFVEILLIVLVLRPTAVVIFHNFWNEMRTPGRVGYVIYFHLSALMLLAFYMINVDYAVNYPSDLSAKAIWGLTVGLALLVELFLFGFFHVSNPDTTVVSTPTLRAHLTQGAGKTD